MLKGLQVADEKSVAIPANWPENELIGDKVIIPPASNVETAAQRVKAYDCYNWWFCYKAQDSPLSPPGQARLSKPRLLF